MQVSDDVVSDLRRRLRRVEGQVRALESMLAEGRECREIVTQLSAANKALEQVGFRLISSGWRTASSTRLMPRHPVTHSKKSSGCSRNWPSHRAGPGNGPRPAASPH